MLRVGAVVAVREEACLWEEPEADFSPFRTRRVLARDPEVVRIYGRDP